MEAQRGQKSVEEEHFEYSLVFKSDVGTHY